MSIKRLDPEAVETFAVVLHPRRRYSARASYLFVSAVATVPASALATEASDPLVTEGGDYITKES